MSLRKLRAVVASFYAVNDHVGGFEACEWFVWDLGNAKMGLWFALVDKVWVSRMRQLAILVFDQRARVRLVEDSDSGLY